MYAHKPGDSRRQKHWLARRWRRGKNCWERKTWTWLTRSATWLSFSVTEASGPNPKRRRGKFFRCAEGYLARNIHGLRRHSTILPGRLVAMANNRRRKRWSGNPLRCGEGFFHGSN